MRKITYYSLVAALVLLFAPQTLSALNWISYTASYADSPTIGIDTLGGVTYATVSYGDLYNGGEPGKPSLPIEYFRFSVPYNSTNFSVTAISSAWTNYTLDYLLYPCQAPWIPDEEGTPRPVTLPDTAAYYSGTTYPSHLAWVADEGFLAGENHIVTVAVMPFSYTHTSTSDKVKKARSLNIRLNYTLSDTLSMSPIMRNDSVLRQEGYKLAQSMVVNPNQVTSFAPANNPISYDSIGGVIDPGIGGDGLNGFGDFPGVPGPQFPDTTLVTPDPQLNDTTGSKYNYLIVTTPELYHSVRRLAALKRQKGYSVRIVTLDQVLNNSFAQIGDAIKRADGSSHIAYSDDAGKIRQYLKRAYSYNGIEYVLLAGRIPYRYKYLYGYQYEQYYPTDIYYSELNFDWSSDGIEITPELYVGRIIADSSDQIDNYTDKLYRYELNPGKGDASYLRRALFSEGRDFHKYQTLSKRNFEPCYPEQVIVNDTIGNNSLYPTAKNIIDTLSNRHVGFVSIINHGAPNCIRVYGPDVSGKNFYLKPTSSISDGGGFNCLRNKDYPMIFSALCCKTVPFDIDTVMNMGESFTTGKDYGGPVYIGYTRKAGAYMMKEIQEKLANRIVMGDTILGKADALSKFDAGPLDENESVMHAYIGDPSLEIWTDTLRHFSNVSVLRDNNSLEVSGINTDSVTIVCFNEDGKPLTRIVPSGSITISDVSPNNPIMLYKHNYFPYIAPMLIQNVVLNKSQYVIADDVMIGKSVDSNRLMGNVTVESGVEYEIEASGTVTLDSGFSVEHGATFAVYPSCF